MVLANITLELCAGVKYIDLDTQNAWGILQEICGWIVGYCGDLRSGRVARSKTGHNRRRVARS